MTHQQTKTRYILTCHWLEYDLSPMTEAGEDHYFSFEHKAFFKVEGQRKLDEWGTELELVFFCTISTGCTLLARTGLAVFTFSCLCHGPTKTIFKHSKRTHSQIKLFCKWQYLEKNTDKKNKNFQC